MNKLIHLFLTLALLQGPLAWAQNQNGNGKKPGSGKVFELPPLTVTPLSSGLVTDHILGMGVTRPIPSTGKFKVDSSGQLDPQKKSGFQIYDKIDLVGFEVDAISDFLQGKGIFSGDPEPLANRGFIVLRYGLEDDRALELFQKVRKLGIHSAVLVTDGPISMDNKLAQFGTHVDPKGNTVPDDFTNDIRPEYFLDRANGKDLKSMFDSGYKLYSPVLPKTGNLIEPNDFYMSMSAIAHPDLDRTPIMHEKEVVMYVLKDAKAPVTPENIKNLFVIHGTGNWTRVHYNRNYIYSENSNKLDGPAAFVLKHAFNTLETFVRAGKSAKISDVPTPGRRRLTDSSGSFWELAYSDGRYELNQRMVDEMNLLAGQEETLQKFSNGDPAEYARLKAISQDVKINEVLLSHFVMTNSRVLDALVNLWKSQKDKGNPFIVRGGLDAKFVNLRGFGLGALMAGYDVQNSYGNVKRSVGKDFAKSTDLVVQMEEREGATNVDPDGIPHDRVLWHDKTTMINYELKSSGKKFSSLHTGSYNNSNNFSNMERQDWLSIPQDSALAQAVRESIVSSMAITLKGPRKGLPLDAAVFAIEMGVFLGQVPTDLDWTELAQVRAQIESLQKQTPEQRALILKEIGFRLNRQGQIPSRLIPKLQVKTEDLKTRVGTMVKFFEWYSLAPVYVQGLDPNLSANEMLGVALAMLENPISAKQALKEVFWRPGLPEQNSEARAYRIYQYMGLESYFSKILPAGQSAKFPFSERTTVTPDLMDQKVLKSINDLLAAGRVEEAASALRSFAEKNAVLAPKLALLGSADEIRQKLYGYLKFGDWYQTLATETSFPYPVPTIKTLEILNQVLTENLDLLLLKDSPDEAVHGQLKYLISLRGYRDNRDGSPGALTEMLNKAQVAMQAPNPGTATNLRILKPTAVGSPARMCRQVLGY